MSDKPTFSTRLHQRSLLPECFHTPEILELVEIEITPCMIDFLCNRAINIVHSFSSSKSQYTFPKKFRKGSRDFDHLFEFTSRLLRGSRSTICTVLVALVYLERAEARFLLYPTELMCNEHEILLAATMTADKYIKDGSMKNKYWSVISSLYSIYEVANIERWFLNFLDYDLNLDSGNIIRQGERLLPTPLADEYYFKSPPFQPLSPFSAAPSLSRTSSNSSIDFIPSTPSYEFNISVESYSFDCAIDSDISPREDLNHIPEDFHPLEESPTQLLYESPSCIPMVSSAQYAVIQPAKLFHLPTGMTRNDILSLKGEPAHAIISQTSVFAGDPEVFEQRTYYNGSHRYATSRNSFSSVHSIQANESDLVALLG